MYKNLSGRIGIVKQKKVYLTYQTVETNFFLQLTISLLRTGRTKKFAVPKNVMTDRTNLVQLNNKI